MRLFRLFPHAALNAGSDAWTTNENQQTPVSTNEQKPKFLLRHGYALLAEIEGRRHGNRNVSTRFEAEINKANSASDCDI